MKKFLLLAVIGASASPLLAQSNSSKESGPRAKDSSKKYAPVKLSSAAPDTRKALESAAFQDLFETDGLALGLGAPRLNPRAVSFVKDYIDRYGKNLMSLKEYARPIFNMIDGVFLQHNLPRELKYLAVIESRLNPVSVSVAGAGGPWQFMPSTAIRMGLKVNRYVDERTNYVKSTEAAAKYLTELYDIFGDWLLVIAAYNSGPGYVQKAIKRTGSRNFWDIQYFLPQESRNHVKKFIGTHYIFEGQGGLTTLTLAETKDHLAATASSAITRNLTQNEVDGSSSQSITGKYNAVVIANAINMDIALFNHYNPGFDKVMASAKNTYELKLPSDKMEVFNSKRYQILNESINILLNGATIKGNATPVAEKLQPKQGNNSL